ncbi:MAG TPA: DUF2442 domain-containing protein [Longimicrobium sp.]|nr:DUF2442 domain-containing protein [Longimicrobium sp.]
MADIPTEAEILAQLPAARERERIAAETEPRAASARYDRRSGRIVIELMNGCMFAFPAAHGQGLREATARQLATVEVVSGGSLLIWDELDAALSVPGLLAGVFGSKTWMRELGRLGGQVQTEAKARAARENGKKGGRPKKARTEPELSTKDQKRRGSARRQAA